ncbi:putative siderophore iron transporter [Podospora fimiseda]|uniref:Siderophore iron transporter n=1 Tax=Podospora fimiseda TaxID=252190 RepID=A0AAN6YSZ8_9PEZI|nr:putative siderophore iron transporter [Podospora fimiseda]
MATNTEPENPTVKKSTEAAPTEPVVRTGDNYGSISPVDTQKPASSDLDVEKNGAALPPPHKGDDSDDSDGVQKASISSSAQAGVQEVEAAQALWTKTSLGIAYGFIWLIYFITSLEEVAVRTYSPFVTSDFASHSLVGIIWIPASIAAGLLKLPLAKILDIWGRPIGMAIMLHFWSLGFVLMASSRNVEMYAAAQVFSTIGSQGVSYCITVFIADTSSLKNRGFMLAFATSPYIITTWIGGPMADAFMRGPGWRWGFGVWAILTPAVVSPLIFAFFLNQYKARKMGLVTAKRPPFSLSGIKQFIIDFDLFGLLLLAAGMAMVLLPLSIYTYQEKEWRSPLIICLLIFGGLLVIAFIVYEKFFAPVNFIPLDMLKRRNVLIPGLTLTLVFANAMIWGTYFTSMSMVAWNLTITEATYISNIYRTGSCLAAIPIGYLIRRTRRFKWAAAYYSLPLMTLGVGLLIHFRQPTVNIGYVAMTQIFIAFAGGPIVVAAELAMMSEVDHQQTAAILAILDLFGSVGTAIGSAVATGVWTTVFPNALRKHLPNASERMIKNVFGSLYAQLGYRVGTPNRIGISYAYSEAQEYLLIIATCVLGVGCVLTWFWRDVKLSNKSYNGII